MLATRLACTQTAHDPFNYTAGGTLVGQTNATGEYWTAAGSGSSQVTVASGNLSIAELSPPTGASVQFGAVNEPSARFNLQNTVTDGTLCFSFTLKVTSLGALNASGGFFAGFNNSKGTETSQPTVIGTRVLARAAGGGFNLGVAKNTSTAGDFVWAPTVFSVNQTIFVVGSYTFNTNSSADDVCKLWLNPSTYDFSATSAPPATLVATNGGDITSDQIGSFVFFQRGAGSTAQFGSAIADELRVGPTWASVVPRDPNVVDASTLSRKFLHGYQGWHAAQGDGSTLNRYVHWAHDPTKKPATNNIIPDIWPDLSEFDADELFATDLVYGNGQPTKVYSANKSKTVNRHFKWMRDYGIDGVYFQRFTKDVFTDATWAALKNTNMVNARVAAETYGRVFCVMFDISNDDPAQVVSHLQSDWAYLTGTLQITNSPRHLRHRGKPVVAVWGLGFTHVNIPTNTAQTIINWFKSAGCTVVGGVPYWWRTLNNDSQSGAGWLVVYRSFDVLSPWAVGRYQNTSQADSFRSSVLMPDLADCAANGVDYMPVVFPGYSAANLNGTSVKNGTPRLGGRFYWRQIQNALSAGSSILYGAMFDEVDEGTAIYKLAPTSSTTPQQKNMFALDVDGEAIPNDWYLRVAGAANRAVRGDTPLATTLPISPTNGLTLLAPNGGETWTAGGPANVTWSSTGVVNNVTIELSTDGGASWRALAFNVTNSGSVGVTVPYPASTNCRVRIAETDGSPADWSDAAFTLQVTNYNGALHAEPLWTLSPGSRSYLPNNTATSERGLAYDANKDELFVISRNGGLSVNVLNGTTGDHLRTLNLSGISGGGFILDKIGVTDDSVIYAGNVTTPGAGSAPSYKLYRWANSDSNTPPANVYTGNPGYANGTRVGDTFALRGAGTNTQILVNGRGTNALALFRTSNGTNFTPTLIATDASNNWFSTALAFGAGNTFFGKTNREPLVQLQFSLAPPAAVTTRASSNGFAGDFGTFGFDASRALLAGITLVDGPDQLNLYNVSNPTNPPVLICSWNLRGNNENPLCLGAVAFGGNRLYALESNNGLLALTIVPAFAPRLMATASGTNLMLSWTNLVPGYVLEKTMLLPASNSWQTVTQGVAEVGGNNVVTDRVSAASSFYRLRKPY